MLAKMPLVIEFSGPLVAPRTAVVRAKAPGTLLSLAVGEGSRVKAGQSIGEIDLSDLQTRVSERSAMVESAQATLLEAERQHTANVGLAAQNFISSTALQTSQARLDAARAQLKSAQAQLFVSRIGVKEASLVAPISGIVGKRHVVPGREGERRAAGGDDRRPRLARARRLGRHARGVAAAPRPGGRRCGSRGSASRCRARSTGSRRPPRPAPGRSASSSRSTTRTSATAPASTRQARVELADDAARLTVPAGAVGQASGQDFVWAIENGALVRRIVITGRKDPAAGRVEVSKGLTADTQVLAARFDNLKEGRAGQGRAPARGGERLGGDAGERAGVVDAAVLRSGAPPCGSPASRSTTPSSPPW